jgi:DNA-binding LacI/PurR family transcriptional regulator
MKPLVRKTLSQQTAEHLLDAIRSGLWVDRLPGVAELALYFKVSGHTVRAALEILEADGVLKSGGSHLPRKILAAGAAMPSKKIRVGILPASPIQQDNAKAQWMLSEIQSNLERSGHIGVFMSQSLEKMKHASGKVLACLDAHPMDAWIVCSPSRNVLEALSTQNLPVYSLGGNFDNLPIAGSRIRLDLAFKEVIHQLVQIGHRRIVLIGPDFLRNPVPGPSAIAFVETLVSHGIAVGKFHLPDWEETPEGLGILLESLFRTTPPTALLVVDPAHTAGVLSFIASSGLRVPEDVSILALMGDPTLDWCRPRLSTLNWPHALIIRHIHRWVERIAREGTCHDQALFSATLVAGETLAPAPARPAAG